MGKSPKQIALRCLSRLGEIHISPSYFSSFAAQLILNPTADTVDRITSAILRQNGDPSLMVRFTDSYSSVLFACSIALDMIRPEVGEHVTFLAANKLFGSEDPDDEEVGDYIIHSVMQGFDVREAYETVIDSAKLYLKHITKGNDLEELKSLKRYELRLARLKHNMPRK